MIYNNWSCVSSTPKPANFDQQVIAAKFRLGLLDRQKECPLDFTKRYEIKKIKRGE